MKKLGARLAALAVLSMIAVGCGSTAEKIKLGMTEQEVIAVLGEPEFRVPADNSGRTRLPYYGVEGADINTSFTGGKVSDVRITQSPPEMEYPP